MLKSVALVDLPPELQLRILEYLEPFDVLRLRRACKTLHHVSCERILWISILCRLVERNTIFEPSFSIHQMSLLELEYAATSPDRWLRLVRSSTVPSNSNESEPMLLRPCHAMVLEDKNEASHGSTSILRNIRSTHLVLGGRYFITVSNRWLAVWDIDALGRANLGTVAPLAVASAHFNRVLLVHATPDKQGLRILLTSYGELYYDFYIYEIYPQQEDPKLLKIAQSTVENTGQGMSIYSISKNHLLFLRHSTLNLWDFSINKWCCISVDWRHNQTIITESSIVILYDDHVKVWSIPEQRHFTRDSAQTSGTSTSLPSACTIRIPLLDRQRVIVCEGLCDWYSGTSQRQFFDYLYSESRTSQRFELRIHNDLTCGEIIEHDITPIFQDSQWFEPALVCNDHIVDYWMAENRIHVRTSIAPIKNPAEHDQRDTNNTVPEGKSSTFILFADDSLVEESFYFCRFCPFSGRMVYVHESGQVWIFDFLSRPSLIETASLSSMYSSTSELDIKTMQVRQLPLDSNDRRRLASPDAEDPT